MGSMVTPSERRAASSASERGTKAVNCPSSTRFCSAMRRLPRMIVSAAPMRLMIRYMDSAIIRPSAR